MSLCCSWLLMCNEDTYIAERLYQDLHNRSK